MARFYLTLPDPDQARIGGPYGFKAHAAEEFARELQAALAGDGLFNQWKNAQPDPDQVDPALGATDPDARVTGEQHDLRVDLVADTRLSGEVLKHRMRLLAGANWQLKDVAA